MAHHGGKQRQRAEVGPHVVRLVTAQTVLDTLRRGGPFTATELMERTNLTRATVIAVCEDLVRRG